MGLRVDDDLGLLREEAGEAEQAEGVCDPDLGGTQLVDPAPRERDGASSRDVRLLIFGGGNSRARGSGMRSTTPAFVAPNRERESSRTTEAASPAVSLIPGGTKRE
jgi:hypothetical protein